MLTAKNKHRMAISKYSFQKKNYINSFLNSFFETFKNELNNYPEEPIPILGNSNYSFSLKKRSNSKLEKNTRIDGVNRYRKAKPEYNYKRLSSEYYRMRHPEIETKYITF